MNKIDDVIVVGAGLGGLVLGAMLAKRGRKVTVVEQHYMPGGCATTFRRKSFRFEVSLHALDGMDQFDPKMYIFRDLGILDKLPFVHIPRTEFYRFKHPELDITIPGTVDGAIQVLSNRFPHERKRIREFFRTVTTIRRDLNKLFMMGKWERFGLMAATPFLYPKLIQYWNTTIGDYLDSMFKDEMLKLALVANILYFHDDPRKLSLFWYALSQGSFISGGVHFIKGGSQVLSDYLARYIREHGGEVLIGQTVEEILVEGGQAVGVRYRKTLGDPRPVATRRAQIVVVNAALPMAVKELIKAPEIARYREKVSSMKKSCSFLSLFLGFNGSPKALGNEAYSTIIPGDDVSRIDDMVGEYRSSDWTKKGFEFVDYSQIDHGLAPAGKSVAVVSLVDYLQNWDNLPEEQYKAQKEEVAHTLIDKLNDLVPGVRDAIERYEVATPKTIVRYTKNPEGCIYGFQQNVNQTAPFRLSHSSPIKNLYFASAWVMPGGGYTGAMLSGLNCAREIEQVLSNRRSRNLQWQVVPHESALNDAPR
jgi:phytoene dehydrogenase-like protein